VVDGPGDHAVHAYQGCCRANEEPPRIQTGRLLCALLQDGRSWRGRRRAVGSDFLVVVSGEETLMKASVEGSLTPMVLLIYN
jgi:hypothetical protein